MIFQQILNEEAGCLSYLIGCGQVGQAAVVDPARDRVDEYVALARRKGLAITEIVDTHVHADHVSGNQALAEKTGARILLHPAAEAAFRASPIEDGQEIVVGNVGLRVLHTPGHTPESSCFLLDERALFTGDTVFLGAVGRPDLEATTDEARGRAHHLYRSLSRLLELPETTLILPAHTSTPVAFDSRPLVAPLGAVREQTALLNVGESEFVQTVLARLPPTPPNHHRIVALNEAGTLPPGDPTELEAGANRCAVA